MTAGSIPGDGGALTVSRCAGRTALLTQLAVSGPDRSARLEKGRSWTKRREEKKREKRQLKAVHGRAGSALPRRVLRSSGVLPALRAQPAFS